MSLPPVFVINLDKSTERMAKISKRLDELEVPFERITAVYGAELTPEELQINYDPKLNAKTYRRELPCGEIGCYMSHIKAWKMIIERKLQCAIVLEDDITIENEFKVFAERLASSTGDFDIVKFFCSKKNLNIVSSFPIGPSHQLCRFRKVPSGNQGQLITYDGAKKLLATYERFGRPVDVDIQHWWESGINVLGIYPPIVDILQRVQSDIDSQDTRKNKTTITGALRNLGLRLRYEYNLFTNRQTRPIPKLYKKD
jgi:glycosyl transferase family 25